eukprot:3896890-Prorocentrum_lima.AAC.1
MVRQMERVPFEDAERRTTLAETIRQVQANQELAQSSDWVSALGGTQAGVYLLYGHPSCDWK